MIWYDLVLTLHPVLFSPVTQIIDVEISEMFLVAKYFLHWFKSKASKSPSCKASKGKKYVIIWAQIAILHKTSFWMYCEWVIACADNP